jgi:hypothetical protein
VVRSAWVAAGPVSVPRAEREAEDDLYRAAQDILHVDGEGDGQAFTERAASMLAAIFVAGKREGGVPCLPYARELIRPDLRSAGERLDRIDPLCCRSAVLNAVRCAPDWPRNGGDPAPASVWRGSSLCSAIDDGASMPDTDAAGGELAGVRALGPSDRGSLVSLARPALSACLGA